jgi:hypothetical protein
MDRIPSAKEQKHINMFKQLGLFVHVNPEKLEGIGKGVIVALCADGDQFIDAHGHIASLCNKNVPRCIHTLALNGGALLMSNGNGSLMGDEEKEDGNVLFKHILKASKIKQVENVFLYSHYPCAVAISNRLSVLDQCLHLMDAKQRLKSTDPRFRVSCFFHVHEEEQGESKRRTYFLPKEMWENQENYMPVLHDFQAGFGSPYRS